MQAVRAAAEAQQVPSDTELGTLPSRAAARPSKAKPIGPNSMGPRKLPAASKPSKAKPVIVRKRAQPPADADARQVGAVSAESAADLDSSLLFTRQQSALPVAAWLHLKHALKGHHTCTCISFIKTVHRRKQVWDDESQTFLTSCKQVRSWDSVESIDWVHIKHAQMP